MNELKEKLINLELDNYLALKKQLKKCRKNQYDKLTEKEKSIFDNFADMIDNKTAELTSQLADLYHGAIEEAEFMAHYF